MILGNINIDRSMMPSYDDFGKNPTHLYQLKQERLQGLLNQQNMQTLMQQQSIPTGNAVNQSNRWANNEGK